MPVHDDVRSVLADLGQRTGLRVDGGHRERLGRLLPSLLSASDGADAGELTDALMDAISIDESYFFRHHDQLDHLRTTILPRLLAERDEDHRLQVWSAGCADGEEAYTLAIVLAEAGLDGRASVLGTDLTRAALRRAEAATYSRWALRSPEVARRSHLFTPVGSRFRLTETITGRVELRSHNLMDPAYPRPGTGSGWDVILCRNLLLHLTPAAATQVLSRLVAGLAPGGWLITAPADPPALSLLGTGQLEPVVLPAGGIVYRRHDPIASPSARPTGPTDRRSEPRRTRRAVRREPRPRPPQLSTPAPTADAQPDDGRARCGRARSLLAEGRAPEAVAEAMAAAFLAPDLPAAHLTLGLAAAATGQPSVAARAFRRAAALLEPLAPEEPVDLCDGETAGPLTELARAHALLYDAGAA